MPDDRVCHRSKRICRRSPHKILLREFSEVIIKKDRRLVFPFPRVPSGKRSPEIKCEKTGKVPFVQKNPPGEGKVFGQVRDGGVLAPAYPKRFIESIKNPSWAPLIREIDTRRFSGEPV
jgi:hypothetical protein